VVENGSRDASAQVAEEFPDIQLIRLPKNFGLTKALNLGWRAADAEYVLFLHEDTEVEAGRSGAPGRRAGCGCRGGGGVPAAGGPGKATRAAAWLAAAGWRNGARPRESAPEPVAVEYPRGAALMARVFLIKAVRQIDERYGQFGGDADLAAQISPCGKKILLIPGARVRHYGDRPNRGAGAGRFPARQGGFRRQIPGLPGRPAGAPGGRFRPAGAAAIGGGPIHAVPGRKSTEHRGRCAVR
jgi:GT2 family glycosyltransferase